jgi:preprotein translocase subunit SecA
MNLHRDVIYKERDKVLEGADMRENVFGMVEEELREVIAAHLPGRNDELWDREMLIDEVQSVFPLSEEAMGEIENSTSVNEIEALILDEAEAAYELREQQMGAESMRLLERLLMLQIIDRLWVEHLTAMDEMRQGIGLQAYGQQDPLVAYKREAHDMWGQLLQNIRHQIARAIYHVGLSVPQAQATPIRPPVTMAAGARPQTLKENRSEQAAVPAAKTADGKKIGRNDPCWCGSGKKFKRCHGLAA